MRGGEEACEKKEEINRKSVPRWRGLEPCYFWEQKGRLLLCLQSCNHRTSAVPWEEVRMKKDPSRGGIRAS